MLYLHIVLQVCNIITSLSWLPLRRDDWIHLLASVFLISVRLSTHITVCISLHGMSEGRLPTLPSPQI